MKYLFFDTETNGLPKNYKAPHTDTDNWPQTVQIAWTITDAKGRVQKSQEFLIKPTFELNLEAQKTHGKTLEELNEKGVDIKDALLAFKLDILACEYIVAHNIGFDRPIILAEFHRNEIKTAFDKASNMFHVEHS